MEELSPVFNHRIFFFCEAVSKRGLPAKRLHLLCLLGPERFQSCTEIFRCSQHVAIGGDKTVSTIAHVFQRSPTRKPNYHASTCHCLDGRTREPFGVPRGKK